MAQVFLFIFCLLFQLDSWGTAYTLADLEVLSQEGSYDEFFKHALDIRPSERQETWKAMVSKMGDGLTRKILGQGEIKINDFRLTESLFSWPSLKADDVFRARRLEIGLIYLKTCLKSENPCWKELQNFWLAYPEDSDTAFKLAEMVSQYPASPLNSWTYLQVALQSSLSEFYCKKEFAMNGLWHKLELDYIRLGPKGDLLKKIDETVHPDCLPHLLAESRKRLHGPQKGSDRELAFQILKSQSKADQRLIDFFYTVYLLETPGQGDLFNYSWNRLSELGSHATRREQVLSELKKLDPLPDAIFGSLDLTKKRVILNHFKKNFPEFLDFYADQCVLFYGGKGNFPQGNPTIHCQDLMNSDMASELLDETRLQNYRNVRKI